MPFSKFAKWKSKKDCVFLQVHKPNIKTINDRLLISFTGKRVSLFAFPCCEARGSVTIEALLSVSLFMMFVVFVMNFMIMLHSEVTVQTYMNTIVQKAAKMQFYIEAADEVSDNVEVLNSLKEKIEKPLYETIEAVEGDENPGDILQGKVSGGYLLSQLYKELSLNDSKVLRGIRGIRVSESRIQDGIVDFVLCYEMKVPMVNKYFPVCQRARVKDWTGTDIARDSGKVYITRTGQVYHKSKNCSHLIVRISKTSIEEVTDLRNSSGGRYCACELCAREQILPGTALFVTEDGDRYHLSLQCKGITRHIIEVDISQTKELRPCSECYGGD